FGAQAGAVDALDVAARGLQRGFDDGDASVVGVGRSAQGLDADVVAVEQRRDPRVLVFDGEAQL
ncbi:MAG TPA: hypothetical protein VGF99_07120, partial [Myxococcota bacterium]